MVDVNQATARAVTRWENARFAARQSLLEAAAGQALRDVKALLPRGEWKAWLAAHGIQQRTAQRWMRLPQVSQIGKFDTVDAALKAYRAPVRTEPAPPAIPDRAMRDATRAERTLADRDREAAREAARQAAGRARMARETARRAAERRARYGD